MRTLLLSLLLLCCFSCKPPQYTTAVLKPSTETIDFIVLQLNDVYEIAPLEGGTVGGLARVATLKKQLLKENPNTIAILSGDFLSPSFIGTLKINDEKVAGLQMIEALNAMGMDYVTFGNHEFDLKSADLLEKRMSQSNFEWTICNAFYTDGKTTRPFQKTVDGKIIPSSKYAVREFSNSSGDKMKLGLIGVVLPFNKVEYVKYDPIYSTFEKTYQEAKKETDLCLGITHLVVDQDIELAKKCAGVPLYMGGHDHVAMNHYVENTVIAKADANAKTVYIHRISFHPGTGLYKIRSTLQAIDDSLEEDLSTKAVVDKWSGKESEIMVAMGYEADKKICKLESGPLVCKEVDVRNHPTNYGRLTTDAMAKAWPGADIYMINSGSMRLDDDLQNVVTVYDVLRTFPFGGSITKTTVPGKDLNKLLKAALELNRKEGGYMQIKNVQKNAKAYLINNQPIDEAKSYQVVLPSFVAKGYEANLGFLKQLESAEPPEYLDVQDQKVKNDIRDIVINHMLDTKSF